jgi:hypothetical protein
MNGFENLAFCAALYGMRKAQRERRAKELLEQFGLAATAFVPIIFAAYLANLSGINWLNMIGSIILIAITSTFLGLFISVSHFR